jgi:hypothetical protein
MKPSLTVLKDKYMICQADASYGIPGWMDKEDFFSFTKTCEEISVICKQKNNDHPEILNLAPDRKIIRVNGPFDLSVTGIIAGISGVLAGNDIPLFTISTYNTDHILVSEENLENSISALRENGYEVTFE